MPHKMLLFAKKLIAFPRFVLSLPLSLFFLFLPPITPPNTPPLRTSVGERCKIPRTAAAAYAARGSREGREGRETEKADAIEKREGRGACTLRESRNIKREVKCRHPRLRMSVCK